MHAIRRDLTLLTAVWLLLSLLALGSAWLPARAAASLTHHAVGR